MQRASPKFNYGRFSTPCYFPWFLVACRMGDVDTTSMTPILLRTEYLLVRNNCTTGHSFLRRLRLEGRTILKINVDLISYSVISLPYSPLSDWVITKSSLTNKLNTPGKFCHPKSYPVFQANLRSCTVLTGSSNKLIPRRDLLAFKRKADPLVGYENKAKKQRKIGKGLHVPYVPCFTFALLYYCYYITNYNILVQWTSAYIYIYFK